MLRHNVEIVAFRIQGGDSQFLTLFPVIAMVVVRAEYDTCSTPKIWAMPRLSVVLPAALSPTIPRMIGRLIPVNGIVIASLNSFCPPPWLGTRCEYA